MPIINLGNRFVNNYLYPVHGGYVLIDTGYEQAYTRFLKRLAKEGIDPGQILYVFLTHAHDDHAGFLNELLKQQRNIRVIASEKALPGLYRGQNSFEGGCAGRLAWMFCSLMKAFGKGAHRFSALDSVLESRLLLIRPDNKAEAEQLLEGTILETPGHTADSLSLLLPDGTLFCGDAAMNGFPSRHHTTIWMEDKTAYFNTWSLLLRRLYPGHGRAFDPQELGGCRTAAQRLGLYPLKPDS